MLPNLIVIGAAKCGTTSLHHYLAQHPQIAMSQEKELDFFVAERNWSMGVPWYESQFPGGARVRGESSPRYSVHPYYRGVPERMASVVPDARLIYHPIDRLVSEYRFFRWVAPIEKRSFEEAVANFETSRYVSASRYAMQLERYLERFPLERILFVNQADLADRRAETLRRVFRFLGVNDSFTSPAFERCWNRTDIPVRNATARPIVKALDRLLGRRRSGALRAAVPGTLLRPFTRSPGTTTFDPGLRAALADYLREDTERLRALTGEPFAGWSL